MNKKLILLGLILSVILPLRVNAENNIISVTPIKDNPSVRTDLIEKVMTKEKELKGDPTATFVQGVGVACKNGKNELTNLNDEPTITCANGNPNPYKEMPGDGLKAITSGSTCSVEEHDSYGYYAYGTRVYSYLCAYTGDSEETKKEYVADSGNTTTTTTKPTEKEPTKDDTNEDVVTTTKATGTTENKDTGVEDYFLVLTTIGVGVIVGLYILDKKNVFTRI